MKILIVGGGGREHALAWKLAQSAQVEEIIASPGNPGIAAVRKTRCANVAVGDIPGLVALAQQEAVGLVVVGPEDPLAAGLVDRLADAGIPAFGPVAAAAQLEASKAYAKAFMEECGIPTGAYAAFDAPEPAKAYVHAQGAPIVVKADGLAAGKGVSVCMSIEEAEAAIDAAMVARNFGDAGTQIVIEEYLSGEEASILALCDGTRAVALAPSQDHKPAFDDDRGPNTGGMGAYAPAPVVTPELMAEIQRTILDPAVRGMAARGIPYRGVLYAGLMLTAEGPKVIEFNCRFGDPETQVVLPLFEGDLLPWLLGAAQGQVPAAASPIAPGACVTVVMASGGYPGAYPKGVAICGISAAEAHPGVTVFHAGTATQGDDLVTNGGRVLAVTAQAADIPAAIAGAYDAVREIAFDNAHYRSDIGRKALQRLGLTGSEH